MKKTNILPRRGADVLCVFIIVFFLPIVFLFEMVIVLPAVHDAGGFLHNFTFVLAMFLVSNIKGNMLACMMIDTSVDHKSVTNTPKDVLLNRGWHECTQCDNISPPRSWHCEICKTCILKRDHHCPFTGCCIGHKNQRYYIMFILYLLIGAVYALAYNSYYIWVLNAYIYNNWYTPLKMVCPMILFMTGFSRHDLYLFFYSLNILAVFYSVVLIFYHGLNLLRGNVSFEQGKKSTYNEGWKNNLKIVFGQRMHLAWISPLIKSSLIHNGIDWMQKQTDEDNTTKIEQKNK